MTRTSPDAIRSANDRPSTLSLYRRATFFALVVASLLFVADNLIHPKEYAPDHEAEQLRMIADHYTRWQVAHVLAIGTIFLYTAAVLGLAFLVRRRAPTLGLLAGVRLGVRDGRPGA